MAERPTTAAQSLQVQSRMSQGGKAFTTKAEKYPWQSTTVFEPSGNRGKGEIPTKKPTAENDDALMR